MVVVAQLVRASVCGTEGRGFEPHLPPQKGLSSDWPFFWLRFFRCMTLLYVFIEIYRLVQKKLWYSLRSIKFVA